MKNKLSTTQQINDYVWTQQMIMRHSARKTGIKKADRSSQEVSAFNTAVINLTKVYQPNQVTQGVNQYATV